MNFVNKISSQGLWSRLVLAISVGFMLTACNGDGGDDLDKFMRDAANDMRIKIKPLPEVKPYMALQFNADGILIDPFKSRKAANKGSAFQPDLGRPKEPMESYPLESIKYVGLLSRSKLTYALLKTPDNSVQQVKIGNFLGQNLGVITKITDSEIILKEIVRDDTSGDWVERKSSLTLQE